ncbi:glycosyltransferase WbuB [Pyruvatibacter sp.]|uniref:glycosyltransferase WbuB n=1 Tax=Pyruvatibacter sp. TaxID=1981328 RepID=UPI003265538F
MRILIHGINYTPDEIGIPKYTTEMAEWFAARGHQVRVVTAPPYYPAWKVPSAYKSLRKWRETLNKVRIVRSPIYVPDNPTGLKRLLHLTSFAVTSALPTMLIATFWRPHVVMGIAPALTSAPATWMAARLGGSAAWLHIQDFELDAAFEMGLLKGEKSRGIAETIEKWILRRFDRVSTISKKMMEGLERKGVNPKSIRELRNWVDVDAIQPMSEPSPFRAEWKASADDIICLYSGNIANKQGLEIIIDAADQLAEQEHIKFVVCGQGSGHAAFSAQAQSRPNITMLPLQPFEHLNALLNAADIHMLPQKAGAADLVLPSKLTGMLASGRPVVATAEDGSGLAGEVDGCGITTPPEDAKAFAEAIQELADTPALRDTLGKAARAAALARLDVNVILARAEAEFVNISEGAIASSDQTTPSDGSINPPEGR